MQLKMSLKVFVLSYNFNFKEKKFSYFNLGVIQSIQAWKDESH